MLVLSGEEIRSVFTMRDAIEADKEAFVLHSQGRTQVSLRTGVEAPGGTCLFMPAFAGGIDRPGIKIVSVFPGNAARGKPVVPALVVLLDGATGEAEALLDGTTLTQMRTAAIAGAATELLALPDASVGALFGTGGQAEAQLEALLTVRPLVEVRVYDIDPGRVKAFLERVAPLAERHGARLVAAASPEAAVEGAQVVTAVTTSPRPVFPGSRVEPGTHVNGVGSYTPQMQELDEVLLARADRVFVDNREAVLAEAGDLIVPMRQGCFGEERLAGELGQLILGQVPGRGDREEITVMKTVGFAALDVVAGHRILEKARAAGVGRPVSL